MGRRIWSRAAVDRLIAMRDVLEMKWPAIGDEFDDTAANCCVRYHYYKKRRKIDDLRRGDTARRRAAPAPVAMSVAAIRAAIPDPPPKPERPAEIVHRPRYFHEADADIAARIRRQGVTAGFLGDPPPGRSALDQRRGTSGAIGN